MSEKRKNVQLTISIPSKIRYNGISEPVKTRNLSCGGIFLQTPQQQVEERPAEAILTLPDGKPPMIVKSQENWTEPSLEEFMDELHEEFPQEAGEWQDEESFHEDEGEMVYSVVDSEETMEEIEPPAEAPITSGLEFSGIDPEDKVRLNEYITRNIREDVH